MVWPTFGSRMAEEQNRTVYAVATVRNYATHRRTRTVARRTGYHCTLLIYIIYILW